MLVVVLCVALPMLGGTLWVQGRTLDQIWCFTNGKERTPRAVLLLRLAIAVPVVVVTVLSYVDAVLYHRMPVGVVHFWVVLAIVALSVWTYLVGPISSDETVAPALERDHDSVRFELPAKRAEVTLAAFLLMWLFTPVVFVVPWAIRPKSRFRLRPGRLEVERSRTERVSLPLRGLQVEQGVTSFGTPTLTLTSPEALPGEALTLRLGGTPPGEQAWLVAELERLAASAESEPTIEPVPEALQRMRDASGGSAPEASATPRTTRSR